MTAIRTVPSDQQGAEAADRLDTSGDQQTQSREDAVSSKVDDEKNESAASRVIDGHHYAKNETLENAQTTMGNAGNVAGTPTGHRYEGNVAKGGAKIHMGDMDAQAFKAFWGEK